MAKIKYVLEDIRENPKLAFWTLVGLIVLILMVGWALSVIFNASPAQWMHVYCTSSEARAIECAKNGWR